MEYSTLNISAGGILGRVIPFSPIPIILQGIKGISMNTCKIEGCNNLSRSKGLCNAHYARLRRYGNPCAGGTFKIHTPNLSDTPEYRVWSRMKSRCYNKNTNDYKYYGGRGIKVCDRWLHSFPDFYKDMGSRPYPEAKIDREDNNKDYCKDNCHWISHAENMRNTRFNVLNWFTVRSMRRLRKLGYDYEQLRKIYNIKERTIRSVCNNESWRE